MLLSTTGVSATTPVLYSFRRCPYAIRARLAIHYSGFNVVLREVVLGHKPPSLLNCSPKGTVPVLILPNGQVLDESYDIMLFALQYHDPDHWLEPLDPIKRSEAEALIAHNDGEFKFWLDRYKYSDRYPDYPVEFYRTQGALFLARLENKLSGHAYLLGDRAGLADMAVFPFIRQFAQVDRVWFDQSSYSLVGAWLDRLLESPLFLAVMTRYVPWDEGADEVSFP
ncbi:MAG: glutathione S-transferase [Methylococcales bacterium]|jgi:glutathione S-transferase|nr:glutathione S-transferase [Methylococcales bacterium]